MDLLVADRTQDLVLDPSLEQPVALNQFVVEIRRENDMQTRAKTILHLKVLLIMSSCFLVKLGSEEVLGGFDTC